MNLLKDEAFKKIVLIFLVSKIIILAAGYGGYFLIPAETTSRQYITDNPLTNPWAQFDGNAYLDIAKNGYNPDFIGLGNYGWFPLYPLMIRALSFIGYDFAALLIANVFSFLAVIMLYLIVKVEAPKITKKTAFYLLFFPTAYFLTAMYAESVFLFFSLATFYYARKSMWTHAGAFGFFAALARPQGLLMILPLVYLYLEEIKFKISNVRLNAICLLLVPLGTALFVFYIYQLTGDPVGAAQKIFSAHGKTFSMPWTTFINEYNNFLAASELKAYAWILFNGFIAVSLIVLSALSFKWLRKDYAIYLSLSTLLPLLSGSLEGISRYALVLFPAFMLLSMIEERHKKIGLGIKLLYVLFFIMLIVLTIRHVNMHLDPYGL